MAATLRWRSRARQERQQGFSLMELMIAIAIMTILLAIAVPRYSDWRAANALQSATETLMAHIKQARIMAVSSNRVVKIVFTSTGYTVDSTGSQPLTIAMSSFGTGLSLTYTAATLTFNSNGTSGTEAVTLTDADGDSRVIKVNIVGRAYYYS